MFGWIPIIGPIIDGVVHIFGKWQDTQLGKYRVDGTVDVEAMKTSASIIESTKDSVGVRLARDALIWPVIIWVDLIVWVTLMKTIHPSWYFTVNALPPSIEYLPYAVITFLLGAVGLTVWGRK